MESLNELVGKKVTAIIKEDGDIIHNVDCEVLSFYIDDFYFHSGGSNIFIGLNLKPLEDYDSIRKRGLESDDFRGVSLDNIYRYF